MYQRFYYYFLYSITIMIIMKIEKYVVTLLIIVSWITCTVICIHEESYDDIIHDVDYIHSIAWYLFKACLSFR